MANFGIPWQTIPCFGPQSIDSQTVGFVPESGNTLPSFIPGADSLPARFEDCELVRVVVFGSNYGIRYTIRWLYGLNFAQVSEWSFPMPAPGSSDPDEHSHQADSALVELKTRYQVFLN